VLILEAGGVARESIGRYELLSAYAASASKATDSPYCGDNILATQPDPRNTNCAGHIELSLLAAAISGWVASMLSPQYGLSVALDAEAA